MNAARNPPRDLQNFQRSLLHLVSAIAITSLACGCSWVYPHRIATKRWVLYSDQGGTALESAREDIDRIFRAFDGVFELPDRRLGVATILLDGDPAGVTDHRYSPELLGYYVPLFELVRVDTRAPLSRRPEGLRQVLSHEIAHHYLACEDSGIAERCWLNEGLAGALETAIVDTESPAQFPLIHPILFQLTRRYLAADPREGRIHELIHLDWDGFHSPATRERNYAFSWSLAYYVLEHESPRKASLGDRIRYLASLSDSELTALERRWRRHFERRSLAGELLRLARNDSPETSRWALAQIGQLSSLESAHCLEGLIRIADHDRLDPDEKNSTLPVWLAFLGVLSRTPHAAFLAPTATRKGLERIRSLVRDAGAAPSEKATVFRALTAHEGALEFWAPSLVEALGEASSTVRAAAVDALSRLAWKPTILNPSFWREASESARAAEIEEWRRWLTERGIALSD